MRIAFFTETFLPKVDGIVNTLCRLLEFLNHRGHECIVFAPDGGPSSYAGAQVIGLPGIPFLLYPELRMVPPVLDVSTRLKSFKPDLIHLVNPVSLGVGGLWNARSLNVPVVASYQTDVPGFAARWGLQVFSEPLWSYFRWLHNQADLNFAPSHFTQAQLVQHGFKQVKVWGRGVDTQRFHPNRRSQAMRYRLSNGDLNAPLLLYVGRVSSEKRIDWLLPVLERLPQARLAVVGGGPQRPFLEKLFGGTRTVFTGFMKGDALAGAYASADLFVFPAANETFGNVVLEAMASGLPVVAPRDGGFTDRLIDRKNGVLFNSEDQADFVDAVASLAANPTMQRKISLAARQAAENAGWDGVMEDLLDEYTALIELRSAAQARPVARPIPPVKRQDLIQPRQV